MENRNYFRSFKLLFYIYEIFLGYPKVLYHIFHVSQKRIKMVSDNTVNISQLKIKVLYTMNWISNVYMLVIHYLS